MMKNKHECVGLIQKAVNTLYEFEQWENTAMIEALSLGIQGKKRESRYDGAKYNIGWKYLSCKAFGAFEAKMYPTITNIQFEQTESVEMFLDEYKKGIWHMYFAIHELANAFVIANMQPLSKCLFKSAKCLFKAGEIGRASCRERV